MFIYLFYLRDETQSQGPRAPEFKFKIHQKSISFLVSVQCLNIKGPTMALGKTPYFFLTTARTRLRNLIT